jgi:hypothetical protein
LLYLEIYLTTSSPYSSKIITISVGPEPAEVFNIHYAIFEGHPYFKAAFQDNAFVEGSSCSLRLKKEDPIIFAGYVQYLYEGRFFPYKSAVSDTLETPLWLEKVKDGNLTEYTVHHRDAMRSGVFTTTEETHKIFQMLLDYLCFADRYCSTKFFEAAFEMLRLFPIGPKEVVLLVQTLRTEIPAHYEKVKKFLNKQVICHASRLKETPEFIALIEAEASEAVQEFISILAGAAKKPADDQKMEHDFRYPFKSVFVMCIKNVDSQSPNKKFNVDSHKLDPRNITKDSKYFIAAKVYAPVEGYMQVYAFPKDNFMLAGERPWSYFDHLG